VSTNLNPTAKPVQSQSGLVIGRALSRYGIVIAFFVICFALSLLNPYFFTRLNIINVLRQASINGILAIG